MNTKLRKGKEVKGRRKTEKKVKGRRKKGSKKPKELR